MKKGISPAIPIAAGMLLLILDPKTALSGASEGIRLCIGSVVPSLFPFFVLSILAVSALSNGSKWIPLPGSLCGIPKGAESIPLIGFLGGYPVGAQAVTLSYHSGSISLKTAQRMLGFCSNAGPSFLFGIIAGKFDNWWAAWVLWGIHILSALAAGALLPEKENTTVKQLPSNNTVTLPQALERAVKNMALVCGWVILFRVFLSILDRWVLWLFSIEVQVFLLGLLELTNGCCELELITSEGLRFIFASAFLGFGGICVGMQTASVTTGLGTGWYYPGKLLQGLLSVLIASCCVYFLYPAIVRPDFLPAFPAVSILMLGIFGILLRKREKSSRNPVTVGV